MKILQIINSLETGGAEKLLLDLLPLYNEKGFTVDLLLLNSKETPFLKKLKKFNCCKIYYSANYSIYNPIHIFKIIPRIKKYDLVHAHLFPTLYWLALAKQLSPIKLLYTEHCTTNRRVGHWLFKPIDMFIYRKYDKVICLNKEVELVLKKQSNLPDNRIEIIENGVDLTNVNLARPYKKHEINKLFSETDHLLIQIAAFRGQKDQKTLIKSLLYLPDSVKLLLVGDGELRLECENLVKELDLKHRVVFLGIRTDIPRLLKSSSIVVLSSLYEGLSLSAIEGMASGRPFVASDVPGLRDLVKGAGVLFKQGDSIELAKKIEQLLDNENYYDTITSQCNIRSKKYDISVMLEKHINLYKRVISQK